MKILLYHQFGLHGFKQHNPENTEKSEETILERAAKKKHMLRKTVYWDILLFFMMSIGGTLLFLFSPALVRIPAFCALAPVRNSIWENLKMIYMPALLTGLLRYLCTGNLQRGILTTYAQGTSLTLAFFLIMHYLYTGILGTAYFRADMLLFYTCVVFLVWYLRSYADRQKKSSLSGVLFFLLMTGCFIYFTFYPPAIGLFQEISL